MGRDPPTITIGQSARQGDGVAFDYQIKVQSGTIEEQVSYKAANDIKRIALLVGCLCNCFEAKLPSGRQSRLQPAQTGSAARYSLLPVSMS
jgi:hypothetical protein